ncbi:hypothetical protein BN2475_70105 [Paraburkholderia ribeironis]|uniref:Uncharacterized protein n=1 Tax=Paraburkholderia ribeironis TaxID=1247936 RepID=A0A1N7RN38_9BURK|nr:hypothetical protein BN2475_70105 [Paraburkholderia ribeironis]
MLHNGRGEGEKKSVNKKPTLQRRAGFYQQKNYLVCFRTVSGTMSCQIPYNLLIILTYLHINS